MSPSTPPVTTPSTGRLIWNLSVVLFNAPAVILYVVNHIPVPSAATPSAPQTIMSPHSRSLASQLLLLAIAVACCSCSPSGENPTLDIATTTSVVNSGAMDILLPLFREETGVTVRVHAAGSGRALAMLADRTVDLVISHAPQAEARMLAEHRDWRYQKIATNQFLIVGPPADLAGVRRAPDAATAFRRIAEEGAYFLSRGDGSGTNERELELWDAAHMKPQTDRLLVSGAGMGATLRQASEKNAYTLTDDATFMQMRNGLALQSLFAQDRRLVNSYAVVYAASPRAAQFGDWLSAGSGRRALATYATGGVKPFRLWPARCPGGHPAAPLCVS